jgi:DNA-binding IclR family transcriptional regulator
MSLEYFTNEKYKILKTLLEYEISIDGIKYSPLTQDDLAKLCKLGKSKVNKLIKELIFNRYIFKLNGKRGKYSLSNESYRVIDQINGIEDK